MKQNSDLDFLRVLAVPLNTSCYVGILCHKQSAFHHGELMTKSTLLEFYVSQLAADIVDLLTGLVGVVLTSCSGWNIVRQI